MRLTHDDVEDPKSFAEYARQELGVPRPKSREWGYVNKELKAFWGDNPHATWGTLTRGVAALKENRVRPPESCGVLIWIINALCAKGDLSTVTPVEIDKEVLDAVRLEPDRSWQLKLLGATGPYRDVILKEWRSEREPLL